MRSRNNRNSSVRPIIFSDTPKNWLLLGVKFFLKLSVIGVLITFLYDAHVTLRDIVLYALITVVIVMVNYVRQIQRIEFSDAEMTVIQGGKECKDRLENFQFQERERMTRTLVKYHQLIITNSTTRSTFKLDSLSWADYNPLKLYLTEHHLLQDQKWKRNSS